MPYVALAFTPPPRPFAPSHVPYPMLSGLLYHTRVCISTITVVYPSSFGNVCSDGSANTYGHRIVSTYAISHSAPHPPVWHVCALRVGACGRGSGFLAPPPDAPRILHAAITEFTLAVLFACRMSYVLLSATASWRRSGV
eukprot:6082622-Pleurochrysis_carterae.AAC.4